MDALLKTVVGNIHPVIIKVCKGVQAYAQAIATKDMVAFLRLLRFVCSKNPNGRVTKNNGEI